MLASPYKEISKKIEGKLTVTLLVSIIILMSAMRYFDAPLKNNICTSGIVSFELANDLETSIAILTSWDIVSKTSAGMSMGLDFLFIIVYSLFISILIHLVNEKLWKDSKIYFIGILLIYCIFLAAFFDIIENIALIKLLLGDLKQKWSSIAYYFAIVKFTLLAIGILFILISSVYLLFKKIIVKN